MLQSDDSAFFASFASARKAIRLEGFDSQLDDASDFSETLLTASDFANSEPHPRQWVADQWLPDGLVTGFFGDGGLGKSLITQQLATCVATGQPFYGLGVTRGPAMMVTCEDERNELQWRQHAINRQLGIEMRKLDNLAIAPRLGLDNELVHFKLDGSMIKTSLFDAIREEARARRVKLLTLDNVMHLYPDDANNNGRVTRFVAALNGLAQDVGCAVLLVGHVAKQAGSQYSGGAAWNNACRSRWFLDRPKAADGSPLNMDWRTLAKSKANYASSGDAIKLSWDDGTFALADFEEPSKGTKGPRMTAQQQIALEELRKLVATKGEQSSDALAAGCPAYSKAARLDDWGEAFKGAIRDGDDDKPDTLKKSFQRSRERLLVLQKVGVGNGYAWIL